MKVVVTCQPARGHFQPVVPLLQMLQCRGHEPVVATSASFVETVERAGIPAIAVGVDWLEATVDSAFPDLVADGTCLSDMQKGWSAVFSRAARQFLPELVELLERLRPDLLLSEGFEYSAALAAEKTGHRHAQVGVGPLLPLPVLARAIGRYWGHARAALDLEPDPGMRRSIPDLYLAAYPPSFQPQPLASLSPVAVAVRPEVPDVDGVEVPATGSRPLVYVTMGTVFNRIRGIFETVLDAVSCEPVDVVMAVGETRDPSRLRPCPENVRIVRFARQADVLRRADLVIFHGGSATTVAALSAGLPLLVLPMGADQFYNALQIVHAGAGRMIEPGELSSARMRRELHRLLSDPTYRASALRVRAELSSLPAVASVVPMLERLVPGRTGP
jgi:UDP:flavonoid glycosyltransferase YjiC (YdhE family)